MTGDVVVHLSSAEEVLADFMIDVEIDSLGEESSDSGVEMEASLITRLKFKKFEFYLRI